MKGTFSPLNPPHTIPSHVRNTKPWADTEERIPLFTSPHMSPHPFLPFMSPPYFHLTLSFLPTLVQTLGSHYIYLGAAGWYARPATCASNGCTISYNRLKTQPSLHNVLSAPSSCLLFPLFPSPSLRQKIRHERCFFYVALAIHHYFKCLCLSVSTFYVIYC